MWQAAAVTVPRIIAGTATRDNPTVLRRSLIALVAAAGRAADDARMRRAVGAGDDGDPAGIRVPPLFGVMTSRLPAPLRAGR
jgi:hypothetical protein